MLVTILLCLPPHTTHALQPLDVAVFKSLKSHFSRALRAWCFTKKDFVVTKRDFARVVKEPFESAFSMANIKSGFAKCGISPLDRRAIPQMKLLPSQLNPSASLVRRVEFETTDSPIHDEVVIEMSSVCEEENLSGPQDNSCESNIINTLSSSSIARVEQVHSSSSESGSPLTVPLRQALSSSSSASLAGTSGTSTGTATSPLSNPLVMAGLVPGNLADILSTSGCEDLLKKPKRRVFKARVLTEQEFFETLKDKEQKEAEMEEMKEQRRIQREQKKKEREAKQKEVEKRRAEKRVRGKRVQQK